MDSFLLISDNMNETLLDIYDLKGDSMFSRVLNVGQGLMNYYHQLLWKYQRRNMNFIFCKDKIHR